MNDDLSKIAIEEFASADKAEKHKLVYAYFGLGAFWTQCLEQTLENMLILDSFFNQDRISQEFVETFFEKLDKSKDTMGRLIKKVQGVYSISDEHSTSLFDVLSKRNRLIHKFFKENSFKVYTDEGKLEMILECTNFVTNAKRIDGQLNIYFENYFESFGIDEEMLSKMLEQAKNEEINKSKNRG